MTRLIVLSFLLLGLASLALAYDQKCIGILLPFSGRDSVAANRFDTMIRLTGDRIWIKYNYTLKMDYVRGDTHGYAPMAAYAARAMLTSAKCANGLPVQGIVGSIGDDETAAIATVAATYGIPVVSPSARGANLGNVKLYPGFFRPVPSMTQEAKTMAIIVEHFGWKRVALLFVDATRAYSNVFESLPDFQLLALALSTQNLYQNVVDALDRAVGLGFRVIIIDADPSIAQLVMQVAFEKGMTGNGNYIFLASTRWIPPQPFPAIQSGLDWEDRSGKIQFNEAERAHMDGLLGLDADFLGTDIIFRQVRDLMAQNPTWFPPYHCDSPTSELYYSYQASTTLSVAFKAMIDNPTKYRTVVDAIYDLDYTDTYGVHLQYFRDGSPNAAFNISNLKDGKFVSIGQWTTEGGLRLTEPVHWPGGIEANEEKPSDMVPTQLRLVGPGIHGAGLIIVIVCLLISLLFHRLLWTQRQHEVIKASSPLFGHIICAGSILVYIGALVPLAMETSDQSYKVACSTIPVMLSLGFTTIFAALMSKTWRIHKIFNSRELNAKRDTLGWQYLVKLVLIAVLLDAIVLAAWMMADLPTTKRISLSASGIGGKAIGEDSLICDSKYTSVWWIFVVGTKALILLYGAYLAYMVRDINHNFNEAKYITLSMYNTMLMAAILIPFVQFFNDVPDMTYLLKTAGASLATCFTLLILYVPKFWDIYVTKAWVDYQSDSSYVSGVLVHRSSGRKSLGAMGQTNQSINNDAPATTTGKHAPHTRGPTKDHTAGTPHPRASMRQKSHMTGGVASNPAPKTSDGGSPAGATYAVPALARTTTTPKGTSTTPTNTTPTARLASVQLTSAHPAVQPLSSNNNSVVKSARPFAFPTFPNTTNTSIVNPSSNPSSPTGGIPLLSSSALVPVTRQPGQFTPLPSPHLLSSLTPNHSSTALALSTASLSGLVRTPPLHPGSNPINPPSLGALPTIAGVNANMSSDALSSGSGRLLITTIRDRANASPLSNSPFRTRSHSNNSPPLQAGVIVNMENTNSNSSRSTSINPESSTLAAARTNPLLGTHIAPAQQSLVLSSSSSSSSASSPSSKTSESIKNNDSPQQTQGVLLPATTTQPQP